MASSIPVGRLRRTFGREKWWPPEPFATGWVMRAKDGKSSVIVTVARWEDDDEWVHASISHSDAMPSYEELATLRQAVWGDDGWAFQVFAPSSAHVNIHPNALHLWGRLDGARVHPDFGRYGSI